MYISYEEPGVFPAPELEPPPYFTPEEIETHGWIIETCDKRTKPSPKYPRGRDRWVSTDKRGATMTDVMTRVREARAAHHAEWEADGRQGVYSVPTFRIRNLDAMSVFSKALSGMLKANHRQQEDFRLDDVAARVRKRQQERDAYDVIFALSGVLSILGGGIVNVNIQMASLKERVREVGVKMAIGAPGREIFKEFLTEALLVSGMGSAVGMLAGVAFSKIITSAIGIPLWMDAKSFLFAFVLATVFGFLFALYPAIKASRLSPMEALRYE